MAKYGKSGYPTEETQKPHMPMHKGSKHPRRKGVPQLPKENPAMEAAKPQKFGDFLKKFHGG